MAYRRTERVTRRLNAKHNAIVAAARAAMAEGGMAAVQMAPVARRAGVAAGTVYRYFPGKAALVRALIDSVSERELAATRRAAAAAPGPLSALAAAVATFGARALYQRRLAWAMIAEPVDAEIDAMRLAFRRAFAMQLGALIEAAVEGGQLPDQDAALVAPALVGALLEGLIGPLVPDPSCDPAKMRDAVQSLTLMALRGLGVADALARGLVVQTALPQSA